MKKRSKPTCHRRWCVFSRRGVLALALVVVAPWAWVGATAEQAVGKPPITESKQINDARFVNHGVLAPVSTQRGVYAAGDDEGNPLIVAWVMDYAKSQLLVIDAQNGQTQVIVPPGDTSTHQKSLAPFHNLLTQDNRLYSLFNHWFYEFDIPTRTFTQAVQVQAHTAMGMTLGLDGCIYIGSYPKCHLLRYDPRTSELTDFGPLKSEDWPQYPAVMAADREGWVYLGVGTVDAQLLAFHPETKQCVSLFADQPKRRGYAYAKTGTDGVVYAQPYRDGPTFRVLAGEKEAIENQPVPNMPSLAGSQNAVLGRFPDGGRIDRISVPDRLALIRDPSSDEPRRIDFDYPSDGARMQSLIAGEDGLLYGSSGLPLRWVSFDPATGEKHQRGASDVEGHLNALAVMNGKLYGAGYSRGVLYQYDPAQEPDDSRQAHLKKLAQATPIINRPHDLLAHPDGSHLVMAGTPGYGHTGGGLMIYDTQQDQATILTAEQILPDHSTMALAALPSGDLLGGTTVRPGTGGQRLADNAELYVLDWADRTIVSHAPLGPGVMEVRDLLPGTDGLVYGEALKFNGEVILFAFDPDARKVIKQRTLDASTNRAAVGATGLQGPNVMAMGDDGQIYVLFARSIMRLNPGSFELTPIGRSPVDIDNGLAIVDGKIYFLSASELWSFNVRQRPSQ